VYSLFKTCSLLRSVLLLIPSSPLLQAVGSGCPNDIDSYNPFTFHIRQSRKFVATQSRHSQAYSNAVSSRSHFTTSHAKRNAPPKLIVRSRPAVASIAGERKRRKTQGKRQAAICSFADSLSSNIILVGCAKEPDAVSHDRCQPRQTKPNKTNALYASFLLSKVHEQVKRCT
jgi:hypothetical protein